MSNVTKIALEEIKTLVTNILISSNVILLTFLIILPYFNLIDALRSIITGAFCGNLKTAKTDLGCFPFSPNFSIKTSEALSANFEIPSKLLSHDT